MRVEPLLKTDRVTLALEALPTGNIRVTTASWDDAKVILKDETLEIRWMDGQLRVARKDREYDPHDPKVEPYDPYGLDVCSDDLGES